MTYKEKLKAYEQGSLNENEQKEIENDIDKFEALLEFFDTAKTPAALTEDKAESGFLAELNHAVNHRINSMVTKTVWQVAWFVLLFLFGISTDYLADVIGGGTLTAFILQGIYSLIYIPSVVYMLYCAFVKKDRISAGILIVWNIVPVVISFIGSAIIGDAFAVFLPAYYGFAELPMAAASLFCDNGFDSVDAVFGIGGMVLSVFLSVLSLVFAKKEIAFKRISRNKCIIATVVFLVCGSILFGIGINSDIKKGYFPDSPICAQTMAEQISETPVDVFTSSLLGKNVSEAKTVFTEAGFQEQILTQADTTYYVYTKGSDTLMRFEVPENGDKIEYMSYTSGYRCINPYYSIENIEAIGDNFTGKTEEETLAQLFAVNILPCYIQFGVENGMNTATYHFAVDIPASEYHFRYTANLMLTFENGVLVSVEKE